MPLSSQLSFGDWDHVFNLPGGYTVHIIIKPSVELNDMYGTLPNYPGALGPCLPFSYNCVVDSLIHHVGCDLQI